MAPMSNDDRQLARELQAEVYRERTQTGFLVAYRGLVLEHHAWAKDADMLDKYMEEVRRTIVDEANSWICAGPAVLDAWRAIGGTGPCTLRKLRDLPLPD